MKLVYCTIISILVILLAPGCSGKKAAKKEAAAAADTTSVPDTGYTGIKKYYSNDYLIKEVTFRNGVREGEMKSFYQGGQVYQRFWYEKGLREDSAVWYYLEGQVFRTTPYKHDTVDGIQKQYYRNGDLKAEIGYSKGRRSTFIKEYDKAGKLISGYPGIVYETQDNYKTTGQYTITLGLTDKSAKVTFYRGELPGGIFDTAKCVKLKTIGGKPAILLKKTGSPQKEYAGVIAEIVTQMGNKYIAGKKIDLPYKDLK
jgi:hypothetical protein